MNDQELRERRRIARHEALHGLVGLMVGAVIEEIRCWPVGETYARFPLHPSTVKYRYAHAPGETQGMVTKIVAALIAPKVVMYGEDLLDEDLALVEAWAHAWSALPGAISARELTTDATLYVMQWHKPRRQWIDNVTTALMQRRKVWGHSAWVRLVQECRPPRVASMSWPSLGRAPVLGSRDTRRAAQRVGCDPIAACAQPCHLVHIGIQCPQLPPTEAHAM